MRLPLPGNRSVEPRVAVSPGYVRSQGAGHRCAIRAGRPHQVGAAGFRIHGRRRTVSADALRMPTSSSSKARKHPKLAQYKRGALVIAIMDPMAMSCTADDGGRRHRRVRNGIDARSGGRRLWTYCPRRPTLPAIARDRGRRILRRAFR